LRGAIAAVIGLQLIGQRPRGIEEPPMTRFESTAAPAAAHGGKAMSDLKRTVRETEADMKEAWRKADGHESLGDKAANLGDRVENAVEDADDTIHEEADKASRDAAYQQGRADEATRR
jgi:phage-related minor tail protein